MKMPGFTAEAALYRTNRFYITVTASPAHNNQLAVTALIQKVPGVPSLAKELCPGRKLCITKTPPFLYSCCDKGRECCTPNDGGKPICCPPDAADSCCYDKAGRPHSFGFGQSCCTDADPPYPCFKGGTCCGGACCPDCCVDLETGDKVCSNPCPRGSVPSA
jgi:hypothetical protein